MHAFEFHSFGSSSAAIIDILSSLKSQQCTMVLLSKDFSSLMKVQHSAAPRRHRPPVDPEPVEPVDIDPPPATGYHNFGVGELPLNVAIVSFGFAKPSGQVLLSMLDDVALNNPTVVPCVRDIQNELKKDKSVKVRYGDTYLDDHICRLVVSAQGFKEMVIEDVENFAHGTTLRTMDYFFVIIPNT
jgi:hypothetical protein